jgi:predicted GNAT family acetyltransferase
MLDLTEITKSPAKMLELQCAFAKDPTINIGQSIYNSSYYIISEKNRVAYCVVYDAEENDVEIEVARLLVPKKHRGKGFGIKTAIFLIEHFISMDNKIIIDSTNESYGFWIKVLNGIKYEVENLDCGKFLVRI